MEKFLWIMDQTHPLFLLVFTSEHSGVPEEVRGKARGQGRTSHKWVLRLLPQALEREGVRGGEEEGGGGRAVTLVAPALLHPDTVGRGWDLLQWEVQRALQAQPRLWGRTAWTRVPFRLGSFLGRCSLAKALRDLLRPTQ